MDLFRPTILRLARNERLEELVTTLPTMRELVARYVPGAALEDALAVAEDLGSKAVCASLDQLGEDVDDAQRARTHTEGYLTALDQIERRGMADHVEVSVKLSSIGQTLSDQGEQIALDNARQICAAARRIGTTVTLDMEDHTLTDSTLAVLAQLRVDYPETGVALQAALRRTEADCHELTGAGSRVRLCKGAYKEPAAVAFTNKHETDLSFVRCLRILMEGEGYPMVASHDPRMVQLAERLAQLNGREASDFEFQMLYGIRPLEQRRLADVGYRIRVYLPWGTEWYGYYMRRIAERPANAGFFLRSLLGRR